ncbi:allophanate hydrolase [Methylibium petroleiphilum]|uniref:allophanate hydrolase n=1 Tax=Methylibium petroleiphilum TaxID=105560 RepID=UPI003D2BB153
MHAPNPFTLEEWQQAYREGATPGALLHERLRQLASIGDDPAWILLASEAQLDDQLAALAARAAGCADEASRARALPLYGVPFAVKDNIDIAGLPTTAACPAFSRTAERSARAVQRLVEAGAVWLGKTNLDQFATGLVGTRSPYGRPASVFAADRVSGGSSSGSAVVVARGDVPLALGTDTAGSGRVPAGFNNIVGLKPTPGRVSATGVLPACRSLDCVSVFAHTVPAAATVLTLIEGTDTDDAYSAFAPGPAGWNGPLRVGMPRDPVFSGDAGYAAAFEQALGELRRLGHTAVPIDFAPLHRVADLLYAGPWVAERHAVVQELLARDPQALDPSVRRIVESATAFSATDAFRGQYRLRAAQREADALWQRVDVLMVPTAPGHPRFDEVDADPLGANAVLGTYTNFVNLLGWCALAVPAGFTATTAPGGPATGLPFGVTFIGPARADAALARFGAQWQHAMDLPLGSSRLHLEDLPTGAVGPAPAAEPMLALAVVGAHLSGLPLNGQLTERGARLLEATTTAPRYRLHALPGTTPPKPGLVRAAGGDPGHSIAVEVWDLPQRTVGSFLALIPPPLGLGSIELADGRWVHGFLCESHALAEAPDVSAFGGWRAYMASLRGAAA